MVLVFCSGDRHCCHQVAIIRHIKRAGSNLQQRATGYYAPSCCYGNGDCCSITDFFQSLNNYSTYVILRYQILESFFKLRFHNKISISFSVFLCKTGNLKHIVTPTRFATKISMK